MVGLFVVPGAGLQTALDVNLAALLQIFAGNLSQSLPQHDVVPLGAVLPLAVFVFEAFVGGQRELRHGCAAGCEFHFGIFSQIADQNDPVQAFACHECCSFRPFRVEY